MVTMGYNGLLGVTGGYRGLQGVEGLSRGYKGLHWVTIGLQWVTMGYRKLQGVTGGYLGLQEVTGGYRGLRGVTGGYGGLQGITRGYNGLEGVSWGYKGLQAVTRSYKGRRAVMASIGIWLWAVALTFLFPNAMIASRSDDFDHFRQSIYPCSCSHDGPLDHYHLAPSTKGSLVFLMISLPFIPLIIIVLSYGYTFVVSQRHRKEIRELGDIPGMAAIKREMKGAHTLAILVAVCLLSIIPLFVVTCLRFFGVLPKRKIVKFIVFDVARGLNAICNPFIYGWRNKELRRAFCKLLKCTK